MLVRAFGVSGRDYEHEGNGMEYRAGVVQRREMVVLMVVGKVKVDDELDRSVLRYGGNYEDECYGGEGRG